MLSSLIASAFALYFSARFARDFEVNADEYRRYFKKSINLALCYGAFSDRGSFHSAALAGKAAFFCCAYDVATDWRGFREDAFVTLKRILFREVTAEEAKMVLGLYESERNGTLERDGLSRGIVALLFILSLVGNSDLDAAEIREYGTLLQIVDDVLDVEDDQMSGDMNCLLGDRRLKHLERLCGWDTSGFRSRFPNGWFLFRVIETAQVKGAKLKAEGERIRITGSQGVFDGDSSRLMNSYADQIKR